MLWGFSALAESECVAEFWLAIGLSFSELPLPCLSATSLAETVDWLPTGRSLLAVFPAESSDGICCVLLVSELNRPANAPDADLLSVVAVALDAVLLLPIPDVSIEDSASGENHVESVLSACTETPSDSGETAASVVLSGVVVPAVEDELVDGAVSVRGDDPVAAVELVGVPDSADAEDSVAECDSVDTAVSVRRVVDPGAEVLATLLDPANSEVSVAEVESVDAVVLGRADDPVDAVDLARVPGSADEAVSAAEVDPMDSADSVTADDSVGAV